MSYTVLVIVCTTPNITLSSFFVGFECSHFGLGGEHVCRYLAARKLVVGAAKARIDADLLTCHLPTQVATHFIRKIFRMW